MNSLGIGSILPVFLSIVLSISIHEAMHAFTAHWLGDTTAKDEGRLTLNPLKHIDLITTIILPLVMLAIGVTPFFAAKPVPFNPSRVRFAEYGAALVGVIGPLTNLLLAIIAGLTIRFFNSNLPDTAVQLLAVFTRVNIGFFLFNMIPFPPLDGSRLLYAFAPEPVQRVMATIESYGFGAILVFILVLYPFISPVVNILYSNLFTSLVGI